MCVLDPSCQDSRSRYIGAIVPRREHDKRLTRWRFGERRYGERKALVESEDWDGPAFQTCMNAGQVASGFETSRRREALSFRHHAEVTSLPTDWQDRLLDEAEHDKLTSQGHPFLRAAKQAFAL